MNEYDPGEMPKLLISFNDLMVLRSIIRGYLAYLRRPVLPAQQQVAQAHLLEGVYARLVGIAVGTVEVCLPLTVPEVHALNVAMLGFAAFVRQKVPPTRERDETLETLEGLRQDLIKTFSLSSGWSERPSL